MYQLNDPLGSPSASAKLATAGSTLAPPAIASAHFACVLVCNPLLDASSRLLWHSLNSGGVNQQFQIGIDSNKRPYIAFHDGSLKSVQDTSPDMSNVDSLDRFVIGVTCENGGDLTLYWATENTDGDQVSGTDTLGSVTIPAASATAEWGWLLPSGATGTAGAGWAAIAFWTYPTAGDLPTLSTLVEGILDSREATRALESAHMGVNGTLIYSDGLAKRSTPGGAGKRVNPDSTIDTTSAVHYTAASGWNGQATRSISGTHKSVDMFGDQAPTLGWKRQAAGGSYGSSPAVHAASAPRIARFHRGTLGRPLREVWMDQSRVTHRQAFVDPNYGDVGFRWSEGAAAANLAQLVGYSFQNIEEWYTGAIRTIAGYKVGFPHKTATFYGSNVTIQKSNVPTARFFPNGQNVGTAGGFKVYGGDIALLGGTSGTNVVSYIALAMTHAGPIDVNSPLTLQAFTIRCPGAKDVIVRAVSMSDTAGTALTQLTAPVAVDCQPAWTSADMTVATFAAGSYATVGADQLPDVPDGIITNAAASTEIPADALAALADVNDPDKPRIACWNKDSNEVNIVTGATYNTGVWELEFARRWVTAPSVSDTIVLGEFDLVLLEVETTAGTVGQAHRAIEVRREADASDGDLLEMPVGMWGYHDHTASSGRIIGGLGIGGVGYGALTPHCPPWLLTRILDKLGVDVLRTCNAPNFGFSDSTDLRNAIREHRGEMDVVIIGDMEHGTGALDFLPEASQPGYHSDLRDGAIAEGLVMIDLITATDADGDPLFGTIASQVAGWDRLDEAHPSGRAFARASEYIDEQEAALAIDDDVERPYMSPRNRGAGGRGMLERP